MCILFVSVFTCVSVRMCMSVYFHVCECTCMRVLEDRKRKTMRERQNVYIRGAVPVEYFLCELAVILRKKK